MQNRDLLESLGVIVSLIVGTGAIGFFFRYAIRLALVEETLRQNNLPSIAARLVVIEHGFSSMKDDVGEMKKALSGLTQLDVVHSKVDMLVEQAKDTNVRLTQLEQH